MNSLFSRDKDFAEIYNEHIKNVLFMYNMNTIDNDTGLSLVK